MLNGIFENLRKQQPPAPHKKSVVDRAEYANVSVLSAQDTRVTDAVSQKGAWDIDTTIEVYKKSPYVNSAIRYIASQAIHAPLRVYKVDDEGKKTLVNKGQPHVALHEWINPRMTYQQLIGATCSWISLTNNCFWIVEENKDPATKKLSAVSIYVANPKFLKVIIDKEKGVKGYRYEVNGLKAVFLKPHQVKAFRGFSPDDHWFGYNNLESLDVDIQIERFGKKQLKTYFGNKAIISGVLTINEDINVEEVRRLEKQFYEQHKGANNAYRIMVLTAGMEYEPLDINAEDDATAGQMEIALETHEAVLGVPMPLLQSNFGLDREIMEYEALFWRKTMMPMLEHIAQVCTKWLAKPVGDDLCVCPDYRDVRALQLHDFDATKVDLARVKSGLNTPNEVRARRNEPAYTGDLADFGDTPFPQWSMENQAEIDEEASMNLAGTEGGRDQSDGSEPELIDETGER